MLHFEEGQVWRYQTRAHESESKLYIVRIDEFNGNRIFHIFLDGLSLKNQNTESGIQTVLPHAPVDQDSLEKSFLEFQGYTDTPPDISEGYSIWREAFDSGDAGAFNIPISQVVQYIEDIVAGNTNG